MLFSDLSLCDPFRVNVAKKHFLLKLKTAAMTDKNTELDQQQVFDPLDMNNYKVEKLPKMEKSGFEKWMARIGGPLAILAFVLVIGS